jgi:DNA-binding NarL/FixJ family response regulator
MIRVLIVDDLPDVRRALRMRLETEPDIEVAGEAGDGDAALALARDLLPDAVLMDLVMPGADGLTATAAISRALPHCAVIIVSLYDDSDNRARALAAGASDFTSKHDSRDLVATIRRVVRERE